MHDISLKKLYLFLLTISALFAFVDKFILRTGLGFFVGMIFHQLAAVFFVPICELTLKTAQQDATKTKRVKLFWSFGNFITASLFAFAELNRQNFFDLSAL